MKLLTRTILCLVLAISLLTMAGSTSGVQRRRGTNQSSLELMPTNCESNAAVLDTVHQMADEDGLIIIIARLGDGERRRELSRRRLQNVRVYLTEVGWHRSPKTVIVSEGERVRGYGRLEIYVSGKLVAALAAERNHNLPVQSCDK